MIKLWFGEGDEPTPEFIRESAMAALDRGETFYAANRGIPPMRKSIQDYMLQASGAEIAPDRTVTTASSMNAIMINATSTEECRVGKRRDNKVTCEKEQN